jgi:hypothetical protein
MSRRAPKAAIPETDYFRQLVRSPPPASDVVAHLAWVRLMSQVIASIDEWAPHFALALVAHYRSLERLRPFCASGEYERAYIDSVPHALNFLRYFLDTPEPQWLKDVARCEVWAAARKGTIPAEFSGRLREILRIEPRGTLDYAVVSHDVLETLQHLVGYEDTTMSRVGQLLWYLQVPPIYPAQRPTACPGIVVFKAIEGGTEMSFLPAEEPPAP